MYRTRTKCIAGLARAFSLPSFAPCPSSPAAHIAQSRTWKYLCTQPCHTPLVHADVTRAPISDDISWRMRRRNASRSRVPGGIVDDDRLPSPSAADAPQTTKTRKVWRQARISQFGAGVSLAILLRRSKTVTENLVRQIEAYKTAFRRDTCVRLWQSVKSRRNIWDLRD